MDSNTSLERPRLKSLLVLRTQEKKKTTSELASKEISPVTASRKLEITISNLPYNYSLRGLCNKIVSTLESLKEEVVLKDEVRSNKPDQSLMNDDVYRTYEELQDMLRIPLALERFMAFGALVCLNSMLTILLLIPSKIVIFSYRLMSDVILNLCRGQFFEISRYTTKAYEIRRDIATLTLVCLSLYILSSPRLEISRMYHDVRGQADVKLYAMTGVLEVADKLSYFIGQSILDVLYYMNIKSGFRGSIKLGIFYAISVLYVSLHSYILIYQTVSLNVAANSYSNALFTLLFSSLFGELKSTIFKDFDTEELVEISMTDLTERFQISLRLVIIALRNILQVSRSNIGLLPNSWRSWNFYVGAVWGPSIFVLGSAVAIDWIKHCSILKFNKVRVDLYDNLLHNLHTDYLKFAGNTLIRERPLLEPRDLSSHIFLMKRVGFPLLASIVCFLRMTLADLRLFSCISVFSIFLFLTLGSLLLVLVFSVFLLNRVFLTLVVSKSKKLD